MSALSDETPATEVDAEDAEEEVEAKEPPAKAAIEETPKAPPRVRRLDIVSHRNKYFLLSLLVIIPGMYVMITKGFLLGIDFAGGTEFTLKFNSHPTIAQVEQAARSEFADATVISAGTDQYIVRGPAMSPARQTEVVNNIEKKAGSVDRAKSSTLEVGGTIAGETIQLSLLSVLTAAVGILALLTFRFRNVPGGWRAGFQFGGSALAALLHDVFLLTGIFAILGRVFDLKIGELNSLFVTAVLTVVGFSVHDTIVVFDRIRENLRVSQRLSFEQVVNLSIMQTAARSIITSFTVVLVLVSILIAGGPNLQGFALALLIGIVSGTYSSIFNAAPLLVVWRRLQPVR